MSYDRYYNLTRWKLIREKILKRDGYLCQQSKRKGRMIQAETVHHVFPRKLYPEYQWELWNLISLTKEEHNALHERNTHELTEAGRNLLRRICRKYGKEVPARYR